MLSGNYRLALNRLRGSKWHSMLTMFGIVVGIVSVITTVSLGEGVRRQVINQSSQLGNDLITVRPGKFVKRDKAGNIISVDASLAYGFGSGSLSEQDISTISKTPGVAQTSSLNLLTGGLKTDGSTLESGFVLGTDPDLPQVLRHKVSYGSYFDAGDLDSSSAIIGKRVAEQLFKENIPIGQALTIRGEEFIVRGVFEEFGSSTLGQGIDLNKAAFVPRPKLKNLVGDSAPLAQILVRPKDGQQKNVVKALTAGLTSAHGGNEDVTVLRQDESLAVASGMLQLLGQLVVAMAAVSLLVGGIGIMNIMLVSVSERTHEIGIRKAIGATNRQIRNQFMAEAVVISVVGGLVGISVSYLVSFLIRVSTNLHPVITWPVVAGSAGVALAVGVIFGTVPAIKAARKDPIESLRIST